MFTQRVALIMAILLMYHIPQFSNVSIISASPALSSKYSISTLANKSLLVFAISPTHDVSLTLHNSSNLLASVKQHNFWEDEKYVGLTTFEPTFCLEDFPIMFKSRHAIIRAANGCITELQMETAGVSIDTVIDQLQAYLGTSLEGQWNTDHISVFIKPGELQRCVGSYNKPVLFLDPSNGELPLYAHEITHLLAGCKHVNSEWAVEGLAVYLNSIYSAYPTWPQYEQDIDTVAKCRIDQVKSLGRTCGPLTHWWTIPSSSPPPIPNLRVFGRLMKTALSSRMAA